MKLKELIEKIEIRAIKRAMVKHGNNKSQVAKELGLKRTTLVEKAKKYNLSSFGKGEIL